MIPVKNVRHDGSLGLVFKDKTPPQGQEVMKTNALTEVLQRGGDVSDQLELMGEHVLQFGKYKLKHFRWLLENDVD
ncbi:uncharacterized protein V6R79_001025 [Siganus canaliculatus]